MRDDNFDSGPKVVKAAEKLYSLGTIAFFKNRREKSDREEFARILNRHGGQAPRAGDELWDAWLRRKATALSFERSNHVLRTTTGGTPKSMFPTANADSMRSLGKHRRSSGETMVPVLQSG